MLTLSLFLVINAVIVWMLGALIHERQSAYQKLERQNAISRMKSQLNEFLIKEGSTQPQVFREACRILVTEGMFSRVCIDESCLDGVVSAGRQTCMYSDSEGRCARLQMSVLTVSSVLPYHWTPLLSFPASTIPAREPGATRSLMPEFFRS